MSGHDTADFPISDQTREKAAIVKAKLEGNNILKSRQISKAHRARNEEKTMVGQAYRKDAGGKDQRERAGTHQGAVHPLPGKAAARNVRTPSPNSKSRKKYSPTDFEPISIIGRGAFGEVRLCRWLETGEVVAIKKLKKKEMILKNQLNHVNAERDILTKSNNPWIVELKCSFQDENYLYLVMEYLAGGDLMSLLMKKEILTEDEGRFYMAEAVSSFLMI